MSAASSSDELDVVVIGGGIHGVGVLQAAAAAGYSALLIEERAIAAGTSSRSSKLIHGGLRYLESGQLRLVRESLHERAVLTRIAPELVRLVPFHIPIYADTRRSARRMRAGLSMYALLGALARDARFESLARGAWNDLDGLDTRGLQAVFRYQDGQTDDAELARAVLRSATELGARSVCPGRFAGAQRAARGYRVRYLEAERERECRASVLVNAAGPWINDVRERIEPRPPGFDVDLVAGAHIEVEGQLARGIYYTEAPRDQRAVFIMPWKERTLVGTTETPYSGDPALVHALPSELEYLQATLARYFPQRSTRVLASWAGLRVLPKGRGRAFDRPRETNLVCDDEREPHLVSIYGGKLTGYRATAQRVIERVRASLRPAVARARTDELPLQPQR